MPDRFRSRGPRRLTDWVQGPGGTGITSLSASGSAILGSGTGPSKAVTIVRTRGILDAFLTQGTASGDGFFGAVGIGIVATPAFTAGITALPTPITELTWDGWLYHSFISCHLGENVGGNNSAEHQRIEVDSKAMRKLEPGQTVFAAVEVVEIGTGVLSVFFNCRQLFKE